MVKQIASAEEFAAIKAAGKPVRASTRDRARCTKLNPPLDISSRSSYAPSNRVGFAFAFAFAFATARAFGDDASGVSRRATSPSARVAVDGSEPNGAPSTALDDAHPIDPRASVSRAARRRDDE